MNDSADVNVELNPNANMYDRKYAGTATPSAKKTSIECDFRISKNSVTMAGGGC